MKSVLFGCIRKGNSKHLPGKKIELGVSEYAKQYAIILMKEQKKKIIGFGEKGCNLFLRRAAGFCANVKAPAENAVPE